jgi:rubrerythrin/uncharacterized membrane protein
VGPVTGAETCHVSILLLTHYIERVAGLFVCHYSFLFFLEVFMKRWICGVCGYVHEGEQPPESCPLCNAPASEFTEEAPAKSQPEEPLSEAAGTVEQSSDSEKVAPAAEEGAKEEKTTKRWRCTVCGYIHEGEQPPDECPVCHVDAKKFVLIDSEEDKRLQSEKAAAADKRAEKKAAAEAAEQKQPEENMKKWRCPVCGYIHEGPEPPETCPVCHVEGEKFVAMTKGSVAEEKGSTGGKGVKRWRCTVCQYECTGDEPPEKCPVCGASREAFVEIDAEGNVIGEEPAQEEEKKGGLYDTICHLLVKHHLHPISAHFPNGIMPAAVLFLLIALFSGSAVLENAAWYNLVVVLVSLPLVLFAGFLEWKRTYRGAKTWIFITKITCGIVVLLSVLTLVIWPLLEESEDWGNVALFGLELPGHWLYFAIACIGLAAVGIAGHLGGKLVYGARQR